MISQHDRFTYNEFATKPISEFIKNRGFNEHCLGFYRTDGEFVWRSQLDSTILTTNTSLDKLKCDAVAAPLWQQVEDWLISKYQTYVCLTPANTFSIFVRKPDRQSEWVNDESGDKYVNRFDARIAAIEKAIGLI